MGHSKYDPVAKERQPWNAGRKLGAKRALKAQQVWAIRFWLDREQRIRDRAMFDLAIDSKLRGCDIVKIKIGDLVSGGRVPLASHRSSTENRRPPFSSTSSSLPVAVYSPGSNVEEAVSTTTLPEPD
jgi:hypothetical protein